MNVPAKIFLVGLLISLAGCQPMVESKSAPLESELAEVPAGWFIMGSNSGPPSTRPQGKIYLDAFAIDKTEVTIDAFLEYVERTGSVPVVWEDGLPAASNNPMVGILWGEADAFCRWIGKRLPTEAEWEKAARGTDGRRYPWGEDWDPGLANADFGESAGIQPVGSFPDGASSYGALDMAGNVQEWVSDYFDRDYYTYGPDRNPQGPDKILDHVLRGGYWASPPSQVTTFFRDSSHSAKPNPRVGFRCAASS